AGGNDLLQLIATAAPGSMEGLGRITANLREILDRIVALYADVTVIVGTVYDPSDGTADLGRYQLTAADAPARRQMLDWLTGYNHAVRRAAAAFGCRVADIHAHFLGHGITEPDPLTRWYWDEMIIEPNARGASEVRRLWLGALGLDAPRQIGQQDGAP
ncbi:MAG: SGNH/GDSL hydrolase family protein, partial [Gemmatimonadales bacterium]